MHMIKRHPRHDCTCCFVHIHFSAFSIHAVFSVQLFSVRRARLHVTDGITVSFSCVARRFKRTEWQCCAGRGWETLSHYERASAQCSALLKKYTKSHTLETLHSCSCNVSPAWCLQLFKESMQLKLCQQLRQRYRCVLGYLVSQLASICNTVMVASMSRLYRLTL